MELDGIAMDAETGQEIWWKTLGEQYRTHVSLSEWMVWCGLMVYTIIMLLIIHSYVCRY